MQVKWLCLVAWRLLHIYTALAISVCYLLADRLFYRVIFFLGAEKYIYSTTAIIAALNQVIDA